MFSQTKAKPPPKGTIPRNALSNVQYLQQNYYVREKQILLLDLHITGSEH